MVNVVLEFPLKLLPKRNPDQIRGASQPSQPRALSISLVGPNSF